jgi:DNA-binding LacI/PurR family transcriptional regulator
MTSIKDVAREAGVSTATVSRALRGLPRVSEETRARVLEAASRLGYVASPHAVGLASGQTRTVAVIVPFVTRWYFSTLVLGAEQVLRAQGYDLLLYNLAGDAHARHRVFQTHLLTKRVDAILVLALAPTPEELHWLEVHAPPVSFVGCKAAFGSSVRIDDVLVARTAMEHLVELGHRRIAYVGGDTRDALDYTSPLARLRGYRAALDAAGIARDPELEIEADWTVHGGILAWPEIAALSEPPTAVFAASDEMAVGLIHAARGAGLRVPEDLSVIGIDDYEMAELFDLTTVAQPTEQQGRIAAQQVLDAIEAGVQGWRPQHVVLPTRLVVRGSTSAPAVSRRAGRRGR